MERTFNRQNQHRRRQNPSQPRARDWGSENRRNSDEFRQESYRGPRFARDMDQERYDRYDYRFRDEYDDALYLADQDFEPDNDEYASEWSRRHHNESRNLSANQYGSQSGTWNRSNRGNFTRESSTFGGQPDRGFSSSRDFSGRDFPPERSFSDRGSHERGFSSDSRSRRGFTGKGPKGYQRSDERICEDVCECLANDDSVDASSIEVKVSNGEITLSGTVDERSMKRMAEDIAERVSGVKDVHNEIRVQRSASASICSTPENGQTASNVKGSEKPTKECRETKSSQSSIAH